MVDWLLPQVNTLRCTGCGLCETCCPEQVVQVMNGNFPTFIHPKSCSYCGLCEDICPMQALALVYEIRLLPTKGSSSPNAI